MSLTRSQFEEELEVLRNKIVSMGSLVDTAVADSMQALKDRDLEVAERVIVADDAIDEMDVQIEGECMRLIALQHPLARDLRLVGTALKVITDLERIADHAVDIAKVARKLINLGGMHQDFADLPRMGNDVREMLKYALDAFIKHDLSLVELAVQEDDEVDTLFHHVRDDLHQAMKKDPELVVEASYLLFVAHYLERMADHAVNIAERVYYVETGHLAKLSKSSQP